MKFIDRDEELKILHQRWKSPKPEFVVLYGKRRVGKTEIIRQVHRKAGGIYFLGDKRSESEQLAELGFEIGNYFDDSILKGRGFADWPEFFQYLKSHIKKRTFIAIDEFPYLVGNNTALPSIFQKGWDATLRHLPILFVLCGSSIAMMESQVLAARSPLFGRRTGQLMVRPFLFEQARLFYPGASFEKCLQLFSIVGGMPAYLREMDPHSGVIENVERHIFSRDKLLFMDMEMILREELREPRHYLAILRAIAFGKRRFSEIINDTKLGGNILPKYLGVLEDLRLIEKEIPVTEKNPVLSKRGLYRILDPYIQFWLLFVYPFRSRLEIGIQTEALSKFKLQFHSIVEKRYESVAAEILSAWKEPPFPIQKMGRWWNENEEIDLVAVNDAERQILFAEAKWSNKLVGVNILEDLRRKARRVPWGDEKRKEHFCLFSKAGFTPDLKKIAKLQGVLLFHMDRGVR